MSGSRQEVSPFDDGVEPATLIELVQYRASHQPDRVAYMFLDESAAPTATLTYRDIEQRARAIAARLQQMNAVNERVLLLYTAGLEFHVAFLGSLYAGAIAVPAYPPKMNRSLERLRALIADAEARIILTTSPILSRLQTAADYLFDLSSFQWLATEDIQTGAQEWRNPNTVSGALAFLQYTSGSTGTPRGVRLTHANLLHNARLVYGAVEHSPTDKYVSWLPTFHDMGFMAGVLQPLYAGIPAVLMSPTSFLQSPWLWLQAISTHKATISGGPNFAYRLCVRHVLPEQRAALNLESWTVAFNGAEPIQAQTLEDFAETFAPCGFEKRAFYPCYGLAEATLMVSGGRKNDAPTQGRFSQTALEQHRVIEAGVPDKDSRVLVSCGRALGGQRVAIVESVTETLCRSDEVGEIWISGPSVADGYWKQTEESKSVFEAYLKQTGKGPFLQSGDLGFLQNGELYITGRLKDLIIIRGANHHPHDIELTVEKSHPALRTGGGAAFSVEVDGEERLVVVQEVEKQKTLDTVHVVDLIRQGISREHELQAHSIVLIKRGTIAKTSSGKIQRYACKAAFLKGTLDEVARDTLQNREAAPEEPSFILKALLPLPADSRQLLLEIYLQEQAGRVLKSPASRLMNDRPLATFGLDSLNAVEFKNAVERDLRVEISLSQILGESSIRDLARETLRQLETPPTAKKLVRQMTTPANESPLSYMQQSFWLIHQLAPTSAAYNVALAIQIISPLSREALRQALQDVVDRHASLRVTFAVRDGQPIQIIHAHQEVNLEEVAAVGWDAQQLNEKVVECAHQPFNLERGPVFRATVFNRSAQDHILLLTAHHIVTDGWSMWGLLDDVMTLYGARKSGTVDALPPRSAEYAEFVRWQAEMLDGAKGEMLWSYWQSELAQLPTLDFPAARHRPPVCTFQGAEQRFLIDGELAQELRQLAAANHTTLYVVLLSVFKTLLHRYTGVEDLVVGSPLHARPKAEFEGTIGCFFNAVVLRTDFSDDPSFTQLLVQTRRKVLRAFEHQDYPSHLLAEKLLTERDPSRPHLFQVTFILQKPVRMAHDATFYLGADGLPTRFGELEVRLLPVERKFARNDLELEMLEAEDGLFGSLQFNTDLFQAEDIARIAGYYQQLLRAVVATPAKRVSQLPMISEAERRQILEQWSNSGSDYSRPTTVSALLDEQVAKNPEKVVAVCGEIALTFSQLNGQAERLANLIERLKK